MKLQLPDHYYGEQRIIKGFAILPRIASHEVRWLEKVVINQEWRDGRWHNDYFIDEEYVNDNT